MSKLYTLFGSVLEEVEQVLKETVDMSHPLVILFRTALEDEQKALRNLLPMLQKTDVRLEDFRTDCSIVYLNDEIVESTFRAWRRAVDWIDHEDSKEAAKLENRFPKIKQILTEAATEIENTYGDDTSKYVIPVLYRPQTGGVR
ncbi:hypothetical protein [Saccharibacillus sp. JS10]|uniref:hypothetical protein n=1 Tax=Saccharibacillus sp. JS10 TaxID=2950552 RepID=UPI00210F2226|nr:hypothetical protein [Saccharibacillus sp. JS10]MCQ4085425.1 hypothetical protein [Saccharibacillus sp. JS10]